MRELEHRFPHEIAVVGVHSGKFTAERVTARIAEAAQRLGAAHPIVNDRQFRVWRAYAVNAWPTLAAVDPTGKVVGMQAGEFTAERIAPFVERLVATHDAAGELDRSPLAFPPDEPAIAPGTLRHPGKVAVEAARGAGARLAIADTGHHRILVGRLEQGGRRLRVEHVVGRGTPGLDDGPPGEAALDSPQGMAFDGDTLWVADAGNHAVRAVDLATGAVRTVAGTGRRSRSRADREAGALASPWDVAMLGGTLYVAMAGSHQLWALDPATGAARPHSGSRREAIDDGPHAEAALAQPMGLAAEDAADSSGGRPGGGRLWFCDAESSAVRWADADPAGAVGTVVGTGLFDFGDRDAAGDEVRLQHPQGIALVPGRGLLVADSYNDALKWVDPSTRAATTWVRGFHEPGGVAWANGRAYVADTGSHRVCVVDVGGGVEELEIEGIADR